MSAAPSSWPEGHRVVVRALGDDPMHALEHHLALEPMPPPDPTTLGPRDVLVRVAAASINWVDLLMTSGQYQHVPAPPYTPGLEYAGHVLWRGDGVHEPHLAVGAAVMNDGFLTGPRSLGAHQRWGGFATYAVAPAEALRQIPGELSLDEATNLLGNYETAWHCLVARGAVQPGETVLVHGASGATGLAAVHVAKRLGATVIATGRSDDKLAIVAAEGADHVLNVKPLDDTASVRRFRDDVKALTGGRGVDVVYDGVGGDISLESLRCMRFGARFLVVGWAATPFVARGRGERGAPNANQLPTNLIMMKGLTVMGCPTVLSTLADPSIRGPRLAWITAEVAAGRLRPRVAARHPLADFRAAMITKWRGEAVGGVVLHP
ncbi:MAG: NADPH:quinone oxidoreductase family protein [Deltaproteobacteria bacterium]|nr:NADPH:quinone oxidoreductase family protein [Deltaproteobacteria bacterium]